MSERAATQAQPVQPSALLKSGVLQRKCACGTHTIGGEQCNECRKGGQRLQRSAVNLTAPPPPAPHIVHDVLNSTGHALEARTRAFMESRFSNFGHMRAHAPRAPQLAHEEGFAVSPADDQYELEADSIAARVAGVSQPTSSRSSTAHHDFSRVRVHTGERAAQAAHSIGAQAFTVGHHIVFGAGLYAPATMPGRALLAHELTHVVQQSRSLQRATLQRSVGGFLRNIFINVPVIGFLLHYSQKELEEYLKKLDETGKIEDDHDSDNKAVAISDSWKRGEGKFVLTARRKALLILEMLSGWVGGDDQGGILNLLERSDNPELEYIFGAGGVKHATLLSEFGGQKEQLYRFYQRRFPSAYPEQTYDEMIGEGAPPAKPDLTKLNAAKPGGAVVQPGDKLPETTSSLYSSVKSKETKRRTDPVSVAEADAWINEVYGQYLPEDKKRKPDQKKGYAEANVAMRPETASPSDTFESFMYLCINQATPQQRRNPEEMNKLRGRCDYEQSITAGYFDREHNEMVVRTDRESPSTRLHEVVHAYADPSVDEKLTHYAKEGLTEYLTRQIISKHKTTKDEKRLAFSQSYGGPYDAIVELSLIVGDAALAKAHFQGDVKSLCQAVGKQAFDQWLEKMESLDGWQEAVMILRQRKTMQKGKGQDNGTDQCT